MMGWFCSVSLIIALLIALGDSGRVLVWQPVSSKSQMIALKPLIEELSRRNHSVVNVAPSSMGISSKLVETIETDADVEKVLAGMTNALLKEGHWGMMREAIFNNTMREVTARTFRLPGIQRLVRDRPQFDVAIITVQSADYGLYMAKEFFSAPIILFSPGIIPPLFHEAMGNPTNPSYIPTDMVSYSPTMNFWQRGMNWFSHAVLNSIYRYITFNIFASNCKEFFNLTSAPNLVDMLFEADLLLINSHIVFEQTRPLNPNTVLVGGINIDVQANVEQLPREIRKFVDGAQHGVVLLSLGSITRASSLPESTRSAILNVISRMKERVVWKWDGEDLKDKPDNLMLAKWLPQQAMLAHPNVRAFITHGGLLSTTEALYHGVPIIVIPGFGDQFANAQRAERLGYGTILNWATFNEDEFESALQRVLSSDQVAKKAQHYGSLLRDSQNSPLENAVFHTEYVMRHKGAKHLRPASLDLNMYQYFLIDVFLALMVTLAVFLGLLWVALVFVCRRCCRWGTRDEYVRLKND